MDFEKHQKDVAALGDVVDKIKSAPDAAALKAFSTGLRSILQALLKDRREQVRPGMICKDAAAKNLVPGDVASRADVLLTKWGGQVTPQDPQAIQDDAARFVAVAERFMPVLKAYQKEPKV